MLHKKALIKATLVFSFLSLLQPVSNFLLLPVYTKFLDVREYGYFSILNNVSVFFSIISGLNIITAIVAFYKSYKSQDGLLRFIGNVITFSIYVNLVLLLIFCLWGDGFSNLIFEEDIPFYPNVFYAIAYGLISSIYLAYFNYLKYDRKLREFAWLTIFQFIILVVLQYCFIVLLKKNIEGALLSRVLAVSVMLLVTLFINRKYIFRKINYLRDIIPQLRYSMLTGPAVLIGWLASYIDRFIIEHKSPGTEMLGQYSLLATICAIAELAVYAFNSAIQPYVFDSYQERDNRAIRNYYKLFIAAIVISTSGLILIGSNMQFLIHNKILADVLDLVPLMAMGYVFFGMASIYGMQVTYQRKSVYYLITYGGALIVNFILNLLLFKPLGMMGIIIASFITKILLGCMMVYFGQRSMRTYALKPVFILCIGFILIVSGCWLLSRAGYLSLTTAVILQFVLSCAIVFLAVKPGMIAGFIKNRFN